MQHLWPPQHHTTPHALTSTHAPTFTCHPQAVYSIDENLPIRKSHENPDIKELYRTGLDGAPGVGRAHEWLHTHYKDRSSEHVK